MADKTDNQEAPEKGSPELAAREQGSGAGAAKPSAIEDMPLVTAEPSRLKLQGIIDADAEDAASLLVARDGRRAVSADEAVLKGPLGSPRRNWHALGRQVLQASRLCAIFIFCAVAFGWPLGAYLSHYEIYGQGSGWLTTFLSTLDAGIVAFAIFVPLLVVICGYILSNAYTILNAAQSISTAAQAFVHPDDTAKARAQSVGAAVRQEVAALNTGVDGALERLALIEAMIRKHVEAIDDAGLAIQKRTSGAVDTVAAERSRLIDLTENLNKQADDFAAAIAERARANIEAMTAAGDTAGAAETRLADRFQRLEASALKALDSFEALSAAVSGADAHLSTTAVAFEETSKKAAAASQEAVKASEHAASAAEQASDALHQSTKRVREELSQSAAVSIEHAASAAEKVTAQAAKALDDVKGAAQSAVARAAEKASGDIGEAGKAIDGSAQRALDNAQSASDQLNRRSMALSEARTALEAENQRLETLIAEQRQRADRLANAIATQTKRLSNLSPGEPDDTAPTPSNVTAINKARAARDQRDAHKERLTSPAMAVEPSTDDGKHPRQDGKRPGASPRQPAPDKNAVAWRDILKSTETPSPATTSSEDKAAPDGAGVNGAGVDGPAGGAAGPGNFDPIEIIYDLQSFTMRLETQLFGEPPAGLLERFEGGERNVFASRILRLNEADVKRRIRTASARDKAFERGIHAFLQGFERLLEDATISDAADEELEEYLSSPLGRVYLLVGATVGYFA